MKIRTILCASVIVAAFTVGAGPARADTLPSNCIQQPWLYGGLIGRWTTRTICDGPIQADGSWQRGREFYAPAGYVPARCSWGYYVGGCTGGYWLPVFDNVDHYPVTADTVLPDEPGHLG